jgi:hypothetical protein
MTQMRINFGIMPGKITSFEVKEGMTLGEFLKQREVSKADGYKISIGGKIVTNMGLPLRDKDSIILTEKIAGA